MQVKAVFRSPFDIHACLADIGLHGLEILPAAHHHHLDGFCALAEQENGPCCPQVMKANGGKSQANQELSQFTGLLPFVPFSNSGQYKVRLGVLKFQFFQKLHEFGGYLNDPVVT